MRKLNFLKHILGLAVVFGTVTAGAQDVRFGTGRSGPYLVNMGVAYSRAQVVVTIAVNDSPGPAISGTVGRNGSLSINLRTPVDANLQAALIQAMQSISVVPTLISRDGVVNGLLTTSPGVGGSGGGGGAINEPMPNDSFGPEFGGEDPPEEEISVW